MAVVTVEHREYIRRPYTRREYDRTKQSVMETMRFVTRRDMTNGWGMMPAGTAVRVTYKRSGLTIESLPCSSCHVRMHMSRVPPTDLDVLEPVTP